MTESDHDWIEYWAVFTDAGGIVHVNILLSVTAMNLPISGGSLIRRKRSVR